MKAKVRNFGVPTYFRACCHEATAGGQSSYAGPAYHLSIHLMDQGPRKEWGEAIDGLERLLKNEDAEGVWTWFRDHYPNCMKLVPRRRMRQFVKGVHLAHEQGKIGG